MLPSHLIGLGNVEEDWREGDKEDRNEELQEKVKEVKNKIAGKGERSEEAGKIET